MKFDSRSLQSEIGHWLTGWRLLPRREAEAGSNRRAHRRGRRGPLLKPVYRLIYWAYRGVSWGRYSLPRRFNGAGLFVGSALAVALIMLPDTENNVAYQAFTLLLFTICIAFSLALVFPARFSARRILPRFGTVGYPVTYTVSVHNSSRQRQAGLTLLDELADPRPSFAEWLEVQLADQRRLRSFRFSHRRRSSFRRAVVDSAAIPSLSPGESAEIQVRVTPLRRGVLRFAGVAVARTDPLGLVRAFSRVALPQSLLVLPKRYLLPPLPLPGAMKYQQGGVALASSVGRSEEFVSLRDYRHGDPLRHIHWRSWARAGRPVVKEFEDEFFVRHALVLDTFSEHPHSPAVEEAVSVAASFACTLQTQESLLDLLFVGPESYWFTSGRGLAREDQMLEILSTVRTCADQPFSELESLVLSHVGLMSGCICVLLAWDEPRRSFIKKLRALNVPVLVLVIVESGEGARLKPTADDPERFYVLEAGRVEQGLLRIE